MGSVKRNFYHPAMGDRKSQRLSSHDYSKPGYYFVTFNTLKRKPLLGKTTKGVFHISDYGMVLQRSWKGLVESFDDIKLDEFSIMPDHFHGIIQITAECGSQDVRAGHGPAPTKGKRVEGRQKRKAPGLPMIIQRLKSQSAREINRLAKITGRPIWQRGYYDRIIRGSLQLKQTKAYIKNQAKLYSS